MFDFINDLVDNHSFKFSDDAIFDSKRGEICSRKKGWVTIEKVTKEEGTINSWNWIYITYHLEKDYLYFVTQHASGYSDIKYCSKLKVGNSLEEMLIQHKENNYALVKKNKTLLLKNTTLQRKKRREREAYWKNRKVGNGLWRQLNQNNLHTFNPLNFSLKGMKEAFDKVDWKVPKTYYPRKKKKQLKCLN